MSGRTLSLFQGYGIEIESMVVDSETLDVRTVVDELLRARAGGEEWVGDVDDGAIGLSNELVNHVVELKTNGPAPRYAGLAADFRAAARRLGPSLEGLGARLMPTGMHPWMDPAKETRLWPHDHGPVYRAYDALFDCRRHGWANLQSVHLNLPFADERELARLLAAVRLVLPLVPALAASSPLVDGHATGLLDNRLEAYRSNSGRVPSMTGDVIPEPVYGFEEYRERILAPIGRDLAAAGAGEALLGVHEWTNARGAIVRFDRMAVEIRLIDAQECAAADLAVCAAVSELVRGLTEERWSSHERQRDWPTAPLAALLSRAIARGPEAPVDDADYVAAFGLSASAALTAGELLHRVLDGGAAVEEELRAPLATILERGTLAGRILDALDGDLRRPNLHRVYSELCDRLDAGELFCS